LRLLDTTWDRQGPARVQDQVMLRRVSSTSKSKTTMTTTAKAAA
jgi:hypothetical protein